jgi:N-acetylmuramoyl-L-alanine amidase
MAQLQFLVIHCTDTPAGRSVSKQDIEQWHLIERGWSRVGYADMIHLDGSIENLIPYNNDDVVDPWEISNGAVGYNSKSRHVVYVGGGNGIDTRTYDQIEALEKYVKQTIDQHPNIVVIGHNQISSKYCPSFNVPQWLQGVCVDFKNIKS